MKHLFVMDPMEKLDPLMDSSLKLAFALTQKGEQCFSMCINKMFWQREDLCAGGFAKELLFGKAPETVEEAPVGHRAKLDSFASIHMRKEPPFDMDYISATWLLATAEESGKRVYNSPRGLQAINEKLSILRYPEAIAKALVSADPEQMLAFIENECEGEAIIKPLTLYSGKGIHRLSLELASKEDVAEILQRETSNGNSLRLIQPFAKEIYQGEVRAFTVGGEPIAWCLKKPAAGEYMANSSFGSTRHEHMPTAREEKLVKDISKDLRNFGIEFVGYDLIGENISEINVTSPRLLTAPNDRKNYYEGMADWVIQDCRKA